MTLALGTVSHDLVVSVAGSGGGGRVDSDLADRYFL